MFGRVLTYDPGVMNVKLDDTRLEADEDLRDRLFYVTGDRYVFSISGAQLDDYAWRYSLARRKVPT